MVKHILSIYNMYLYFIQEDGVGGGYSVLHVSSFCRGEAGARAGDAFASFLALVVCTSMEPNTPLCVVV